MITTTQFENWNTLQQVSTDERKKKSKCGINIIDGLTVMMSNSSRAGYMRMNGQFETLAVDDPEGRTKYGI